MIQPWINRLIDSVADRGRELLKMSSQKPTRSQLQQMCADLLTGAGEARGTALAREVVRNLEAMTEKEMDLFLSMLSDNFAPDPEKLMQAVTDYANDPSQGHFLTLRKRVEPPRQELFRRINLSPGGTQALVRLREHVLKKMKGDRNLKLVDADLEHLFKSWFNRGFLELVTINWGSPALILEKLTHYDTVQPIRNLKDLRRRLADDRRCYAFFHPALPSEPLIFVEVALLTSIPDSADHLLDPETRVLPVTEADSAIFYSINNCQYGLRGISFGNFLIKQVTSELAQEFPHLKHFATFSPLPRFAEMLRATGEEAPFTAKRIQGLLVEDREKILKESGRKDVVDGLFTLLENPEKTYRVLHSALETLALAYITMVRQGKTVLDPVAFFHLSNGARLERINPAGDLSEERYRDSFGVMVNYQYELDKVERNHEGFVNAGRVALSKPLANKIKFIRNAWN